MDCDQCGNVMVKVGREIPPGNPAVWMDGWLCKTTGCPGNAVTDHRGSVCRWPALTLADARVHANIWGAMKFRDAQ